MNQDPRSSSDFPVSEPQTSEPQFSPQPDPALSETARQQDFNVSVSDRSTVSDVQIGGIAEQGDIIQNQGSGNIFKNAVVNFFQGDSSELLGQLTRQDFRNRRALLSKVQNYWIKGVLERSLQVRSPIPVQLDSQPDAVMAPWRVVDQTLDAHAETLPPGTRLIDVFDELGAGRSLLILGSPGSGKTTALLQLAQELVQRADQDATHLIPVVFNLSSWSPRTRSLAQWLEDELNSKYQVPHTVGKSWIEQQNLLLLLDGLDEVQANERQGCLDAINGFYQDYGAELVVCSRVRQYRELEVQLRFEAAVQLRSLTSEQIFASLDLASDAHNPQSQSLTQRVSQRATTDLAGLRTLLQDDADLRDLASSPLMLNIMLMAYQDLNNQKLLDTGRPEQKRAQIFDAYINRMMHRRDADLYSRTQTIHWLSWLAQRMESVSQSIFLIEDLHPNWIQNSVRNLIYNISLKLVFMTLWGGLHVGLIAGLGDPSDGVFSWTQAAAGCLWGMGGGILYGVIGGSLSNFVNEDTHFRNGSAINGLLLGSIFGVVFWASMEASGSPLTYGIAYGIVYFILGIYTYGLIHEIRGFTPIDNLRWSFQKALKYLPFGALIAIAIKLGTQQVDLVDSIAVGLIFQLIIGFESARTVDQQAFPNYEVWRSAINAAKLFGLVAPVAGVIFYVVHGQSLESGLVNGLLFGVGAAIGGAGGAGLNCIKHVLLRIIFWSSQVIPWNYARFLDYGCDRILLQRVGGGYVFIHRSLLEHFAHSSAHSVAHSVDHGLPHGAKPSRH